MKVPVLDLHGYKTADVVDALDRFLLKESQKGRAQAKVMTGKGSGAVKKVVVDYLKKAHYPWEYEKLANGQANEGVLVVFLE